MGHDDRSGFHLACLYGQVKVVQLLLKEKQKETASIDWNDLIETEENGHQLQKSSAETENRSVAGGQQKRQAGKNQKSGSKSSLNLDAKGEHIQSEPEKGKLLDLKSEQIVKKGGKAVIRRTGYS